MARNNSGTYNYEYNLSDHLGNVRYTFDRVPSTHEIHTLQEELGQYDYEARFYDPVIGRWNVVDPHGEKYESISNYSYAFNNRARFIDLKGKDPGDVVVVFEGADLFGTGGKGGSFFNYPETSTAILK